MDMEWGIVVTSAAVGAAVASIGQVLAQWLERRHRIRELTFQFSIEAARSKLETALVVRNDTPKEKRPGLGIPDQLYLAADYYPLVERLLRTGRHPKEIKPERRRPTDREHSSRLR